MDSDDLIRETENVLRELVQDPMQQRYGDSWVDHLGVTEERSKGWEQRRDEERKRRAGAVIDERILWYADFTDLWTILRKNWDLFKPCFGDSKRLEVYLDRLGALRNPGAHSRPLLPFERLLVQGMTGELRQQVTLFRARGSGVSEPEHFPRIEVVRDSFGNQIAGNTGGIFPVQTDIVLRPGDEITFAGTGWDPEGETFNWKVEIIAGEVVFEATCDDFECVWHVTEADIADSVYVQVFLASNRSYHRNVAYDDKVMFQYRVLPCR